jgi:nucleoside-diphosphate-sugar epimerase
LSNEGKAATIPASPHNRLIALTGATGFIGQHLLRELPKRGYRLRVLLRRPAPVPIDCASAMIGDLARPHNISEALAGVDAVIHSAGMAHAMSGVPEDDYRLLNTEATIKLARAAERAGVRRFVFLSSIRAQSGSTAEEVLHEALEPRPTDAYGRSKLAAEQGLAETGLDWVALRLVLTYGPGVQGNMARLAELARSPYPLPLAALKARRSLLSLDNLVEAVAKVLDAPATLKRPFIVADPEALTVGEMIKAMRRGLGRRAALFPVPGPMLAAALQTIGQGGTYRLFSGTLVADSSALATIDWLPVTCTEAGLAAMMRGSHHRTARRKPSESPLPGTSR